MTNSEVLLIGYLNADPEIQNDGLEAFPEIPDERPGRFITVERTGGQTSRLMDYPTWAVQVWAEDRNAASDLAVTVGRRLMGGFSLLHEVADVDVTTTYNWPDESGQARYQMVVTAVLMV